MPTRTKSKPGMILGIIGTVITAVTVVVLMFISLVFDLLVGIIGALAGTDTTQYMLLTLIFGLLMLAFAIAGTVLSGRNSIVGGSLLFTGVAVYIPMYFLMDWRVAIIGIAAMLLLGIAGTLCFCAKKPVASGDGKAVGEQAVRPPEADAGATPDQNAPTP